jgi:iduronate 2-sulfatase
MEGIREAFGKTKIAIGRITDWEVWTHGEVVRQAQADFVMEDGNAALVTSTDEYGNSDKWHYDTAGYIDLGEKFAEAFEEKE